MLLTVTIQFQSYVYPKEELDRELFYNFLRESILPPGKEFTVEGKKILINAVFKTIEQIND